MGKTPSTAGKGDKPRKVNGEKYRAHWDAIFSKPAKPEAGCANSKPKRKRDELS